MTTAILKTRDVIERTRRSRSAILADVKAGKFPQPFRLDNKSNAWLASDIDAWLQSRLSQREPFAPARALTTCTQTKALTVATTRLNDAVHDHVVALASRNGSTTSPAVRYVHFSNASARAIGLPKSDKAVVDALPIEDKALLTLVRAGVAARIPQWAAESEAAGGAKPHNRILQKAKAWAELEVKALRACGIEEVIGKAEALALEAAA